MFGAYEAQEEEEVVRLLDLMGVLGKLVFRRVGLDPPRKEVYSKKLMRVV